jgi:OOP family OmpA-OmpF porin
VRFKLLYVLITLFLSSNILVAQTKTGKTYKISRYDYIYLPLGKISFADSIVSFKMGSPAPQVKYRDQDQCLHEPNYVSYKTPNFLSLGCSGTLVVHFSDNGFMNLKGKDIYIFEVGSEKEAANIEISENGIDWVKAGSISGGKSIIDLDDYYIPTDVIYYYLKITDLRGYCKSKSAGADIDAIAAINSVLKININADVLFDIAKYNLKKTSKQTLDSLVTTIQQIDKATIVIEGHTDSDGKDEYNFQLSKKRCQTVKDKLKLLFGSAAKYDYILKPMGESKPRAPNDSFKNKQINRRVEITVLPPKDYYDSLPDN